MCPQVPSAKSDLITTATVFMRDSTQVGEMAPGQPQLSIILPTYNERENLPLVIWLIDKHLSK
jgi:hypothetical protein